MIQTQRFLVLLILLSGLLSSARAADLLPRQSAAPKLPGWTLTFDDEFSGKTLDLSKWTPTDWASTINSELEYYVPDDAWLQSGFLRLRTRKRTHGDRLYTSGEVRSVGKFSQMYGRFEFRARLAKTQSTWTAEYLIAENDHWPPEIDVEEYLGSLPQILHLTNHWTNPQGNHQMYHTQRDDPATDYTQWHTYAVEWEPRVVRWYFDGALVGTTPPAASVSNVPMYIRINTAIAGWAGLPTSASVWPQYHDIDYVRVYRRNSWPPPVNAGPDQEITFPSHTIQLHGISCDPMGPHVATWSQVGGTSRVTFSHPQALATAATFPAPGTYRLRLTVADGDVSAYDDLTVLVSDSSEVRIMPSADAYSFVNSVHPGIHAEGKAQDLQVGFRPSVENTQDTMQAYFTFDISHAPSAAHAHLRLYGGQVYQGLQEPLNCTLSGLADPAWDENTKDWSAAPVPGPALQTLALKPFLHNSSDRWYDLDVTSYVQAQQQAGKSTLGFSLIPNGNPSRLFAAFHSHEDAALAPHLIITP